MFPVRALQTPLDAQTLESLDAGNIIELSGSIFTARDAAHYRFACTVAEHQPLPINLEGQLLFYAGPCPAPEGRIIGSIAPTTSVRMDGFLEMTYKLGAAGSIGKGGRSPMAAALCKQYRRVYFLGFGGIAALLSEQVKKSTVVAYEDLGAESVKELIVEKLRLIVGIDTHGRTFDSIQQAQYRRNSARETLVIQD